MEFGVELDSFGSHLPPRKKGGFFILLMVVLALKGGFFACMADQNFLVTCEPHDIDLLLIRIKFVISVIIKEYLKFFFSEIFFML